LSQLRTPALFGLVYDDSGFLLGLLLYYIGCKALTLQHAVTPEVPMSMRQYWVTEIDEILTLLQKAGIIWGDGKVANILVDGHNDPWIVNFGGSYTPGWVEKELAGRLKGR
jgi:tRNA A-37 threonylcarbamoyl transferase component Bud32